jgi:ribokinase
MLVILGSINADLLFRVERLPRPGETVLCPSYETAPGGKGANQAAAAAKAGAATRFVGHVGGDAYGPVMRGVLERAGVDCSGLAVGTRPTGIAVIGIEASGENSIIVGSGANLETRAAQVADATLGPGVTVLCQNEIRPEETWTLLTRAKSRGTRTILNLAPAAAVPARVLDALDLLVVNRLEAEAAAGRQGVPPIALARELAARHDLTCVVTLGADGALAVAPGEGWYVRPLAVTPVDTTGAGDCFAGVLAAALDEGLDVLAAMQRATVAAALACEKLGAQTSQPLRAMIEDRLDELPPPEPI